MWTTGVQGFDTLPCLVGQVVNLGWISKSYSSLFRDQIFQRKENWLQTWTSCEKAGLKHVKFDGGSMLTSISPYISHEKMDKPRRHHHLFAQGRDVMSRFFGTRVT